MSGQRLWGWAERRFRTPAAFFENWVVLNYCPLVFLEVSDRNLTPDKLTAASRRALFDSCDRHLAQALAALQPDWAIGIIPASPAANRGWSDAVDQTLAQLGVLPLGR